MKKYSAYGLTFSSLHPLPELCPGTGEPDVHIYYGEVQESLHDVKKKGVCYQISSSNNVLLSIPEIARYLICDGNKIIIHREHGAMDNAINLFLLGSAMGALLHQRGMILFHGNGIVINNKCVVFLGHSGKGKSTLAAFFSKKGYQVLADDLCGITLSENGTAVVNPGYPYLKLWSDTIEMIGENNEGLKAIRPGLEKYNFPLYDGFYSKQLPLEKIYILDSGNSKKFVLTPLKGPEKLIELVNQTYRKKFINGMGKEATHFNNCIKIAENIPLFKLNCLKNKESLDELITSIERDLQ